MLAYAETASLKVSLKSTLPSPVRERLVGNAVEAAIIDAHAFRQAGLYCYEAESRVLLIAAAAGVDHEVAVRERAVEVDVGRTSGTEGCGVLAVRDREADLAELEQDIDGAGVAQAEARPGRRSGRRARHLAEVVVAAAPGDTIAEMEVDRVRARGADREVSSPVPAMMASSPAPAFSRSSRSLPMILSLPLPVTRVVISESVFPC